jgi:hypothetical protein
LPRDKGLAKKSWKFFQEVEIKARNIKNLLEGKTLIKKRFKVLLRNQNLIKNK